MKALLRKEKGPLLTSSGLSGTGLSMNSARKVEPLSHVGFPCKIPGMGQMVFYPYIAMLVADYGEQ